MKSKFPLTSFFAKIFLASLLILGLSSCGSTLDSENDSERGWGQPDGPSGIGNTRREDR